MILAKLWNEIRDDTLLSFGSISVIALVIGLLLFRLGTITLGFSQAEYQSLHHYVGWHGIYDNPFYLPLDIVRSIVFWGFEAPGQLLSRVPNAFFGGLTVLSFGLLVRLWHGTRTAVLATLLFACSAWVLHVSRLATFDILYLWTIPTLLLAQLLLKKQPASAAIWYGNLVVCLLVLYIPGMMWLVLASAWLQRAAWTNAWQELSSWYHRIATGILSLLLLPLLVLQLTRPHGLLTWLGLPEHLMGGSELLMHIAAVPVHLFIRGPQYPDVWLGRLPILDIFSLVACALGVYFYTTRWRASRTRILVVFAILGSLLVALGGPVPLSLLVPLLYLAAATGIAYLLHDWLQVFPVNPFARALGIGLVVAAIGLSCLYNTRAYFVAWAHNTEAQAIFRYHR